MGVAMICRIRDLINLSEFLFANLSLKIIFIFFYFKELAEWRPKENRRGIEGE